ncbi:MAG TPA: hypothetical protein RMH99_16150 [Sandaracinaceae bacterium LLY-WYZ-13_1]|nr:hypothetical protein [Sandaracinaceae bacterium LLY-WYZ-13_1]
MRMTRFDRGRGWTRLAAAIAAVACLGAGTASAQVAAPDGATEAGSDSPMLPDTMETARGMAMGLGARASAASTSGLAYNPAGLSIGRHYHIGSSVTYEPQAARFATGGALIDSHSGPVNMGVNFRYVHGNGEDGHGGYDGRVALGLPLGDHFALGLTGRYMSFWREGQDDADPYAEHVTFDAAIRVTPVEGLHFAALGYNLIDVGSPLAPLQVGGSASYTIDGTFTLAFDGLADLSTFENEDGGLRPEALIGGSAEYFTGEVPIRAGYMYDTGRDIHYVTAGAGWMNEQLGIDIAWRQQVTGPQQTWLLASFRYFIY